MNQVNSTRFAYIKFASQMLAVGLKLGYCSSGVPGLDGDQNTEDR